MQARLSVAIITLNEERNLADCLASVAFADEIIVVDSGSRDRTCEIARAAGARVIEAPDWQGFGVQKNRAIDACSGDWVFSIDADERVPQHLREEIQIALCNPAFDVYEMPRSSYYCGRFMRHSGWWPDHVRRLFRRGTARFSLAPVHESLETDTKVGRLRHPLEHWSYRTMEQVLDKVNRYSSLSAPVVVQRGRRPTIFTAIFHGVGAFFRTYFLKRGFLDGTHGFMLAVSNAEGSYYRYIKAMLLAPKQRADAMLITVIVATYNRPDALAAVLRSLGKQDDREFEVVVADDGSRPDTEAVVKSAQATFPVPLSHVWQEDTGFRLAAVRNRATSQARGDYLIYLDGDCIVRRHFVRAHRALAESGWCVAGGRVLLSEPFTRAVLSDGVTVEDWDIAGAAVAALQGKVNRAMSLARLPLGPLRKLGGRHWERLRGCNFSAFRADIEKINGFDECFQGWGFEDSDFAVRLIKSGVRLKYGRLATNVYHLWHPEHDRAAHSENWQRLQERIHAHGTRAQMGLDEYS